MKRSGRCEEREGGQQGRSIARATRGLRRPSLDARSLAQPCYLPKEIHRPQGGETVEDEARMGSARSMCAVGDSPPPLTFTHRPMSNEGRRRELRGLTETEPIFLLDQHTPSHQDYDESSTN